MGVTKNQICPKICHKYPRSRKYTLPAAKANAIPDANKVNNTNCNNTTGTHGKKMLPKVHLVVEKLQDIASLYKQADCLVSASSFEGFGLPMLEAFAANIQVIAPRASGQLDFLTDENSFLIGVDKIRAGDKYQYWRPDETSTTFYPRVDELAQSMKDVYEGKRKDYDSSLKDNFSWKNSANKIINIYENIYNQTT